MQRRANGVSSSTSKTVTVDVPLKQKPVMRSSPFLPTFNEAALLAIFPLTLLLGSLHTTFTFPTFFPYYSPGPHGSTAVYSHSHQSFQPPSNAPSYFATKRNVFNVYFVKIGWFWVTVALTAFTLLAARGRKSIDIGIPGWSWPSRRIQDMPDENSKRDEKAARLRRMLQVGLRYSIVTLWWVFATQWFFGPSLIDRGFRLTGGACAIATREAAAASKGGSDVVRDAEILTAAITSAACKAAGGRWKNGFDVSGHVFLLTLGSGMLWLEVLPVIFPGLAGLTTSRVVRVQSGRIVRVAESGESSDDTAMHNKQTDGTQLHLRHHGPTTKWKTYATVMALAVASLSWWMLLMTAAFFHTWVEKSAALVLAATALWTVYIGPRVSSSVRTVVGLPGV